MQTSDAAEPAIARSEVGRRDWLFIAIAFQLAVTLLIGGTARAPNVLICFAASIPALYLLLSGARAEPLGWLARIALALYGLSWLQLVPLPPGVWTALPGRGLAAQVLETAGLGIGWRPLALDPGAALAALLSLSPALVLLVAFARLSAAEQAAILKAGMALAIIFAVFGLLQRVTGTMTLYDIEHAGAATGLFANRNHHAAMLACALVLLPAAVPAGNSRQMRLMGSAAAIALFAGILATTSRAGIALGVAALLVSLAMLWRVRPRYLVGAVLALIVAAAALLQVPALDPVFARFALLGEDQRIDMAATSLAAARDFLPWGSGWGSFVPVFMAYEDLDTMSARYVVAAHNDYLQLLLEGGILGLVIGIAGPLALALLAFRHWTSKAVTACWSWWWVCAILLLHSAVDFPLRTTALAVILAIAFAAQEIRRKPLPARREQLNSPPVRE